MRWLVRKDVSSKLKSTSYVDWLFVAVVRMVR